MVLRKYGNSLAPYLLIGIIIAVRNYCAIVRPEFWAEDADEFFVGALNGGASSLLTPIYGYYFLIQRAIAYAASHFPVVLAPLLYSTAALVLNTMVYGYFSRDGFSWIVPCKSHRIFICAILAIGPGTGEVHLNLINLATTFTFLALLLIIELPHILSHSKLIVLVLLALSAGQMLFLIPVAVLLWYFTRSKSYLSLSVILIVVSAVNVLGGLSAAQETGLLSPELATFVPKLLIEQGFIRLFVAPFLGPWLTKLCMGWPDYLFWGILIITMMILPLTPLGKWSRKARTNYLLIVAYISFVATFGAISVARNYAAGFMDRQAGFVLWDMRYSYLPGETALLIWFAVLFNSTKGRISRYFAYLAISLIAIINIAQWANIYKRPDLGWGRTAEELQPALLLRNNGLLSKNITIRNMRIHPRWYHHAQMSIVLMKDGMVETKPEASLDKKPPSP